MRPTLYDRNIAGFYSVNVEEVFDRGGDFINGQKVRERSFDVAYIHHVRIIIWKIGKAHARPATRKINPLSPPPTTDDDDNDVVSTSRTDDIYQIKIS